MPVPSSNSHLKNTAGGSFAGQRYGGTLLGNTTTGDVITKALSLKTNAGTEWKGGTKQQALDNGLVGAKKTLSSGTFAYSEAGKYIIKTISTSLSGVSSTKLLITGADINSRRPIHQFEHDFGVKLLTKWRANQFSRTGLFTNGNPMLSRLRWLDSAQTAVGKPSTLTTQKMWDPVAGNATYGHTDSAANPTRAIPGEFVLKVDFVTKSVSSGGDFFNYKAITGM